MELPKLRLSELCLGEQIGQGGFSSVYELLSSIRVDTATNETATATHKSPAAMQQLLDSLYFSSSSSPNKCRYVVKLLRDDLPPEEFIKGFNDLVTETEILSKVSHNHIIALRAVPTRSETSSSTSSHTLSGAGYFLVLDRLSCTLQSKFEQWKELLASDPTTATMAPVVPSPTNTHTNSTIFGSLLSCLWIPDFQQTHMSLASKSLLLRLWLERMIILRDIADALSYLHDQSIIYRDLKPENIGFSFHQGIVKLFDFGLAKELKTEDLCTPQSDLYKLTGNTGSLRYMAPEVALGHPYNATVDSYSFAILMWQICSLNIPFEGYTCKMHSDLVVHRGFRPPLEPTWPCTWKECMTQAWSHRISDRPSMKYIYSLLRVEVEKMIHIDEYWASGEALPSLSSTLSSTTTSNNGGGGDDGMGEDPLDIVTSPSLTWTQEKCILEEHPR